MLGENKKVMIVTLCDQYIIKLTWYIHGCDFLSYFLVSFLCGVGHDDGGFQVSGQNVSTITQSKDCGSVLQ